MITSDLTPLLTLVHEIVDAAGVREAFDTDIHFHLKVPGGVYMDLVIESYVAPVRFMGEKRHIVVAHNYVQNGDLMADPDLQMTDGGYPIAIQQDGLGLYDEVLTRQGGQTMVHPRHKASVMRFMATWARNLRSQGFLDEAEKMERGERTESNRPYNRD